MAKPSITEVKSIIRGLLVSVPEEMTVSKLRRDFQEHEGCDIPFFEFGFHDVTSFLRSIPDVCQVCPNNNGPYATVRHVESDKSAHVSSLVMRQKTPARKPRRRLHLPFHRRTSQVNIKHNSWCQPNKSFYTTQSYKVHKDNVFKNPMNNLNYEDTSTDRLAKFFEPDPSYSCHNGFVPVDVPSFSQERKIKSGDEYHSYVPEVFGKEHTALKSFIGHLLKGSKKDVHLNEVTEYLKNSLSKTGQHCPDNMEDILRNLPFIRIVNDYVYYSGLPSDEEITFKEASHHPQIENPVAKVDVVHQDVGTCGIGSLSGSSLKATWGHNTRKERKILEECDDRVQPDVFIPTSSNEKIQRLERNLYSLMKDHCEGMLVSELKNKFMMKFAAPLNLKIVGCDTEWELAIRMSHIFNIIPLENGDYKLLPLPRHCGQTTKDPKPIFVESEKESVIPVITKRNIQRFMEDYPNGLLSKDFEQRYTDSFMGGIELQQMGFLSMDEFLKHLEKINVLRIEFAESDIWLFPSSVPDNLPMDEDPLPSHELMKTEVDMYALKQRFPPDVMGPDIHVEQVEMPSWIQRRSMVEIWVQEVKNPHCFWITFRGEQYHNALESLMDDIQAFYCSQSHSYKMPEDLMREGQDCVALYVGEWHRARITCIVSTSEAEVCFYDYGTTKIVQKDNIHYLHVSHSALPAQAIRAALAGVAPVEDEWTQKASKRFLQIISQKALVGIVRGIDRQNNVISLFLCDTSGDDDIYIHDVLVRDGFAVEYPIGSNENELNYDVKSEELLDDQCLHEETKPEGCTSETISSSSILENSNPDSDFIEKNKAVGEKNALCQLPQPLLNNVTVNHQSVSTRTSSLSVDSTLLANNTSSNSAMSAKQFAPPPGFSHVIKRENEFLDCDKRESQMSSSQSVISQAKQLNEGIECIEINTNQTIKTVNNIENQKNSEVTPKKVNLQGTAKGINPDFVNDNSYLQNSYNYSSWAPVPSVYPFTPASTAFPPVPVNASSAIPPLSFGSYPLSMPNPWDYCNLWYYEQCRQQAFVQGMLAHQQMAAATFSPLPPGLYQSNTYSPASTQRIAQNHMNISEVHSSESALVERTRFEKFSADCQEKIICAATQTDLPSGFESSDKDLKIAELPHAKDSPVDAASNVNVLRNEDDSNLHENGSSSKSFIDKVDSSNTTDLMSDEISCHENICDTHNSFSQKTVIRVNSSDSRESDLKNICLSSSTENEISKSLVQKPADTDMLVTSLRDTIPSESHSSKQTPSYSETSQIESATSHNNFGIENCIKPEDSEANSHLNIECCVQRIATSQVVSIAKSEENLLVLTSSKAINEENEVRSDDLNVKGIPRQDASNIFDIEIIDAEKNVQEPSQVARVNSVYVKETSFNKDNIQDQEMINNSQQECVNNEPNLNIKNNSTELPQYVVAPEKFPFKESNGLKIERQMNELTSKLIISSNTLSFLCCLNEDHQTEEMEVKCRNEEANNLEISLDNSLKCAQQLSVQKRDENSEIFHNSDENISEPLTAGALISEFDALSISSEMNTKAPSIQNNLSPESLEKIVNFNPRMQKYVSKYKQQPELSVEVGASSIIHGPTQLPMYHKTYPTTHVSQASISHGLLQTKNSLSCDSQLSVTRKHTSFTEGIHKYVVPSQVDSEPAKNLVIGSPIKNSCKETAQNWHKESHSSSKQIKTYQFIKKIKLSGKHVYQINLDGRPYVLTDEIVGYFTPFNGRHVIIKILEARKVEINFLEMSRRRRPDFFECLDKSDIQCLHRGPTGSVIGSVHMVPLRSVPYMLRALNKDDATLSMEVKEEMEKFDANDSYWFGCC